MSAANPSTLAALHANGAVISDANPLPTRDPALVAEIERLRLQVAALATAVTALTQKLGG